MPELRVRLAADNAVLAVPASLDAITTYVLLEQEGWFEKEVLFVRKFIRPGMTAIDIGANLGVYCIPMARQVGPAGAVFAFEPASETRAYLEQSRALNGCGTLHLSASAVSDRVGEAHLVFGGSSELNALGTSGRGELVKLTSLDNEDAAGRWSRPPDFIKIDAEGEEDRILQGGKTFFASHSPLVMFEIRAGASINHGLRQKFRAMGYKTYRMLGDHPLLVPDHADVQLDSFELNLFAAKPDRATMLSADGLLVDDIPTWQPDSTARREALASIGKYPFGVSLVATHGAGDALHSGYRDCLAAYAMWRSSSAPRERCAALDFALTNLGRLCQSSPNLVRLATLARVAWEAGQRTLSVAASKQFISRIGQGDTQVSEPFWPASQRFDALDPGEEKGAWFTCFGYEQFERARTFSSCFAPSPLDLGGLSANPFAASEVARRHVLQLAKSGRKPVVPQRLRLPAGDHVNAELWSAGRVPGPVLA